MVQRLVPARIPNNIGNFRKSLADPQSAMQPNPFPADNAVRKSAEVCAEQQDGHVHALEGDQDSLQSVHDSILVRNREAGYREGYRAGFLDGYELANAGGAAPTAHIAATTSQKEGLKNVARLRGLPCVNCGRFFYSDEVRCPGCGTAKIRPTETPLESERTDGTS